MSYCNYCLIKPVEVYQKVVTFPIHVSAIFLIILAGFLICFSGYRIVHLIISLCGFFIVFASSFLLLGAYILHSLPITLAISFFLGLLGGVFTIFFYRSGVFLLGVLGGFSFGMVVLSVMNNPIILILLGVIGGMLSLFIEKVVVITATASIGSLIIVWGMVRLFEFFEILSITPDFEPSYFRMVCVLTWFGFGLLGCAVQYKYSREIKGKKKR